MFSQPVISQNQAVPLLFPRHIQVFIKREDTPHPAISGNKYRKLRYNLLEAQRNQYKLLVTFGGAFSNHIAAVAAAGKAMGFSTMGIIRGEEIAGKISQNPTLKYAAECGMRLQFLSRPLYRTQQADSSFLRSLRNEVGDFYLLPEGGTNALAVQGCEEILTPEDGMFNVICCPVGTGGTLAGLANSAQPHQRVVGFSALKGIFKEESVRAYTRNTRWEVLADYHFGGYGKINADLIAFINTFSARTQIPLDPVYTGKMMYGIMDLITKGYFEEHSKILAIHTGGLQGIAGMNYMLERKRMSKLATV